MIKKRVQQKKHILITGGAGFLGINLVRFLVKKGYRVTSLDIADFNYPDVKSKINIIKGSIGNKKLLGEIIKDIDIVIHAATALPLYSRKEIIDTNVDGTKNVLHASYENKVRRVIFISSTAVYGIPDHHPIYETDKLVGVGPYGETKIIAERICMDYRKRGMCVPIVRPKTFVGPERLGVFALLYEWAKDGKNFPILGSGNNAYQLLDVEDLVGVIHILMTKKCKIVNDTFNVGAEKFTTMKEDFQAVLDHAGFGKKIIPLPAMPIIALLRIFELLGISPLYKWIYDTAAKDSYVSTEKAEKILGLKLKYSNKEALIRNYKWYIKNLPEFKGRAGTSHRVPWKQGVLKITKFFF
jgi:nucleoside-diphosphate-sugar epimerase